MEAVAEVADVPDVPDVPSRVPVRALEPVRPERPSALAEPLSPFVPWSPEERTLEWHEKRAEPRERNLLGELLRGPGDLVERLMEASKLQGLVLASLGVITVCTSAFAGTLGAARVGGGAWGVSAVLASCNVLLALAAALGPVYAASVLLAARVPLARLVATLLASAATGSLLLVGLAPPLYLLWGLDSEWAGPLMLFSAFVLSGFAAGARTYRLLMALAEAVTRASCGEPERKLSAEDAFRVGILARVSLMMVAFTSALGFWAFQALG